MMRRCRVNDQTLDMASGVHVDKKKGSASGLQTTKHLQGCEDYCDGVDGVVRCNAGAPTGDWRGRRTDVFTVPEKCKGWSADNTVLFVQLASRTSAIMKFGSARVTIRPRRVSRGCKSHSCNVVDVLQDMMDTAQNEVDHTCHTE